MRRLAAPWRDELRKYKVVVDGHERGRILPGETFDFQTDEGEHSVRLALGWMYRSPEMAVMLGDDETAELICRPGGPAITAPFAGPAATPVHSA